MIWFVFSMGVVCCLLCCSGYLLSFISGPLWQGLGLSSSVGLLESVLMGVVSVIVVHVMLLSFFYMGNERCLGGLITMMMLFVLSMLLFISGSSLFTLFLGWDGLGASSLLLVVWYQSWNSFDSGMTTLLSNRLGDLLFIFSVISYLSAGEVVYNYSASSSLSPFIVVACLTKSAQVPFSVWLPMAMSAPTPISALVHSSTLVTAGLLLALKVGSVLCSESLLVLGVCTMVVAGVISLLEMDLKKIIALSTLSQLGLMSVGVGGGLLSLVLFHMMTHAFIKSALFIVVGVILFNSLGTQDKRLLSFSGVQQSYCLNVLIVCSMALCGLSFTSGAVSKELLLLHEMGSTSQVLLMGGLTLGVAFTLLYCVRLISVSSQAQSCSCTSVSWSLKTVSSSMGLVVLSIVFGWGLSESLLFISPFNSSYEKSILYVCLVVAGSLWMGVKVRGLMMSMLGCHLLLKLITKWYFNFSSSDRVYIDRLNWACCWWVEWLLFGLWDNKEKSLYLFVYVMMGVLIFL